MVTATVTGSGGETVSASAAASSALASDQSALLFHASRAAALALSPPGFGYVHVGLSRIASWIGGANESGAKTVSLVSTQPGSNQRRSVKRMVVVPVALSGSKQYLWGLRPPVFFIYFMVRGEGRRSWSRERELEGRTFEFFSSTPPPRE